MEKIPVRYMEAERPDQAAAFSIRDLRGLLAGKDMVQPLHRHEFFYLLILKQGSGHHEIDFISYPVEAHSVYLMRPGQVHQLTLKAGAAGYLIAFHPHFYYQHDQLLRKVSSNNYYQLAEDSCKKIWTLLTYISDEYIAKADRYQEAIRAQLTVFFIELARQHSRQLPDHVNAYAQERLEELYDLFKTHIATHKQVSQYAALLHLSSYQLNAVTKATVGKPCSALINEYIILEAKRHLLATANQVAAIADQLGYEDVSYFIRFFKKHTGHSPEVFRTRFK
ncbi:helix-turn-helix domain-containing protein [Chitinophaga arvensicola]|uniref:AraC-type DNA-binding protein n=1 Tax=Chitinophaga arvensicola TaxID=29529 RepID=A0A1I0S877_9BACT|nr:AraC family transcriptional regulator [Chitinophaga arvensicola]SEW52209.1 AraC-type DNA-binding protein [Chitinophaga arvensicola]